MTYNPKIEGSSPVPVTDIVYTYTLGTLSKAETLRLAPCYPSVHLLQKATKQVKIRVLTPVASTINMLCS